MVSFLPFFSFRRRISFLEDVPTPSFSEAPVFPLYARNVGNEMQFRRAFPSPLERENELDRWLRRGEQSRRGGIGPQQNVPLENIQAGLKGAVSQGSSEVKSVTLKPECWV